MKNRKNEHWKRERKACSVLFAVQQSWILSNHAIVFLYRHLQVITAEMWDKYALYSVDTGCRTLSNK